MRQQAVVQFGDLLVKRIQRRVGFGALAQQDDAFDHVVIVDDCSIFMADGFAQLSQPDFGRLHDDAQIAHSHRRAVYDFDDGGADVVRVGHQSDRAHVQRLLARAR